MSRTRRTGPVEGFWSTVDDWAAEVGEQGRVRAWWTTSCRREADSGPYLDVLGPVDESIAGARPLRRAVAARGTPLPDEPSVRAALRDGGVDHRRVTRAARFRWRGPAMTPVVVELHTTEDTAVVEAWWEDVWASWPNLVTGRGRANPRRPGRRARASAEVSRLLTALGHEPLGSRGQ